jgi:asparagine synthase (glutamine-hydrolysing)
MLEEIRHRGTVDHQKEIRAGRADPSGLSWAIGANRLPINSGERDEQPSTAGPPGTFLVFNGEVYNWEDLLHPGTAKRPADEADALAHLVSASGSRSWLDRMDWEGAFLMFDSRNLCCVAARDHLGVKPLYHAVTADRTLLFASELKAFRSQPVDVIHPVLPGHVLTARRVDHDWSVDSASYLLDTTPVPPPSLEDLRLSLADAVRSRVPDEKYAVALSGGIDSSTVLRWAVDASDNVVAYTVFAPGSRDLRCARALCRRLGVPHVAVPLPTTEDMMESIASTVRTVETWEWAVLTHSAPMEHLVRQIAADGIRVVLCGEGADEWAGGYEKDYIPDEELQSRRETRLKELHKTNCRRVDRIGMSSTLEVRVPMLQRRLIENVSRLPVRQHGRFRDKWMIRGAMSGVLPEWLVSRPKENFAGGAGLKHGSHQDGQALFHQLRARHPDDIPDNWRRLARFPAEEAFLEAFVDLGYHKAVYLRSRSL